MRGKNPALAGFTADDLHVELDRRASENDATAIKELKEIAELWAEEPEPLGELYETDALFQSMSDWDRDELTRAVAADDGRRAIDILRAQLS